MRWRKNRDGSLDMWIPLPEEGPMLRVHDHWHKGRAVTLKREHVCTRRCLRRIALCGRRFSYCARYSYAGNKKVQ